MKKIFPVYTDSPFDACWHIMQALVFDIDEHMEQLDDMMTSLGRYARQDILAWERQPISKIKRMIRSVARLIRSENEVSKRVDGDI